MDGQEELQNSIEFVTQLKNELSTTTNLDEATRLLMEHDRNLVMPLLDAFRLIVSTSPGPVMMNGDALGSDPIEKKFSNNHQIIAKEVLKKYKEIFI